LPPSHDWRRHNGPARLFGTNRHNPSAGKRVFSSQEAGGLGRQGGPRASRRSAAPPATEARLVECGGAGDGQLSGPVATALPRAACPGAVSGLAPRRFAAACSLSLAYLRRRAASQHALAEQFRRLCAPLRRASGLGGPSANGGHRPTAAPAVGGRSALRCWPQPAGRACLAPVRGGRRAWVLSRCRGWAVCVLASACSWGSAGRAAQRRRGVSGAPHPRRPPNGSRAHQPKAAASSGAEKAVLKAPNPSAQDCSPAGGGERGSHPRAGRPACNLWPRAPPRPHPCASRAC
jgi:hypothetical protein